MNTLLLKLAELVIKYLFKRLNAVLDSDGNGQISKQEVVDKLNYIINRK